MLYKVPNGLEEKYVGPLMCTVMTIFKPIHHFFGGLNDMGKTVGVVGIGGLGHLAVQFAHKMGAKVIALSRGTNKEEF
jgi:D-arabinose 1-dehydrogenase-like Zn-dependent alcohol dehydrogenase